jgi:hypothetical protein
MAADGILPFVMEGWVPEGGEAEYTGSMSRFERTVNACACATQYTLVQGTGNISGVPLAPLPTPTP